MKMETASVRRRRCGGLLRCVPRCGGFAALAAGVVVVGMGGCATTRATPARVQERRSAEAERLTHAASRIMATDPERAEGMLREALAADAFHGPAHNNLGVLLLERGRLAEAAQSLERARQLTPQHPDPRVNLGIALERAGRVDAAIEAYEAALEVHPDFLPAKQALARCQLRYGRADDRTRGLLEAIALSGEEEWRAWARMQLAK